MIWDVSEAVIYVTLLLVQYTLSSCLVLVCCFLMLDTWCTAIFIIQFKGWFTRKLLWNLTAIPMHSIANVKFHIKWQTELRFPIDPTCLTPNGVIWNCKWVH